MAGVFYNVCCFTGMVTKLYIDVIEDLDFRILGRFLLLDVQNRTNKIWNFASTLFKININYYYRFDMNLRDATVLGLVGAGGIGAPLIFAMNTYRWNEVGSILLGIIILVLIIEVFFK